MPRERIPDCLAASDISLVTGNRPTCSKTVLPSKMFESMEAGMLAGYLAAGVSATGKIGTFGGLPIPPGDAEALAGAIRQLAADAGLRRTMGEAGRRFVVQEFDRDVWAARYLDMLERARRAEPGPAEAHPDTSPLY